MWKVLAVLALAGCSHIVMSGSHQDDPALCTTSAAPPIVDGVLAASALTVGVLAFAQTPASTDSDDPLVAGGTATAQVMTILIGLTGVTLAATQLLHMRY